MPQKSVAAELRTTLPLLALVIVVLSVAAVALVNSTQAAVDYRRDLRGALLDRARIYRLALQEESALRGFGAAHDPVFLPPYDRATKEMPQAYAAFRRDLAGMHRHDLEVVGREEQELNRHWLRTIARPLRADPRLSARTLALHRRCSALLEQLRRMDERLTRKLAATIEAADNNIALAVRMEVIFISFTLCVIAVVLTVVFSLRVGRARQRDVVDLLQRALVSRKLPTVPNLAFHAVDVAASRGADVGGDWRDVCELADKQILFAIGDVAGHGLDAAVAMNRARQALLASAPFERDPAQVLARVNASLMLQEPAIVTAVCGFIDPQTFEITYASAGHPSPIVGAMGTDPRLLPHDGIPLGVLHSAVFRSFSAVIPDDATLFLYTDGVIEHGRDVVAGEARLLEATRAACGAHNPAQSVQRAVFGGSAAADDIAILAISFGHAPRRTTESQAAGAPCDSVRFESIDEPVQMG